MMFSKNSFSAETESLHRAWKKHQADFLDDYLIQDVEDPRIQFQSILSRAFLLDALFPMKFHDLIREEMRFSVIINSVLECCKARRSPLTRRRLIECLRHGSDQLNHWRIPDVLARFFDEAGSSESAVEDYLTPVLESDLGPDDTHLPGGKLNGFMNRWNHVLAQMAVPNPKLKVMEAACGSANDFQFWERFGLGRFIDYFGFDLNEDNIANAQKKCPKARFETASAMEIPAPDGSQDCFIVHDLFEHLTPDAMEKVFSEILRVTRRRACLNFFNMAPIPDHLVEPVETYHWNTLSLEKIRQWWLPHAADIQVIAVESFIKKEWGVPSYYNPGAHTMVIQFRPSSVLPPN